MRSKLYLLVFFLTIAIFVGIVEALYINYPLATNRVEMRVNGLRYIKHKKIDYAIFGSSISHDALGHGDLLLPNVYNGTAVSAMTIAGEYFLFKKLLKNKNKIKNVYISFHPTMLKLNFLRMNNENHPSFRYFRDCFDKEFYSEIKEVYPKYENNFSYFRKRKFYFMSWIDKTKSRYFYDRIEDPKYTSIRAAKIITDRRIAKIKQQAMVGHKTEDLIKRLLVDLDFEHIVKYEKKYKASFFYDFFKTTSILNIYNEEDISWENKIFMKKIVKLSNERKIKLHFILEPLPKSIYDRFQKSDMYKELTSLIKSYKGVDLVIANQYFEFEDKYFKDGYHLHHKFGPYYEKIMYNDILNEQKDKNL